MFILGLNLLFGIYVYLTLIYGVLGLRMPGHTIIASWGPSMLYAAMIGLGAQELWNVRRYYEILKRREVAFAINAYFSLCLLMAVQIPFNLVASGSLMGVINGLCTWLLPVVAVFGVSEENWKTIRRTLCWQSAIGCLCLLYAMPTIMVVVRLSDPSMERISLLEIGGGILGNGGQLLYAGTFLLLSFYSLSLFGRLTALTTVGLALGMTMIGQFRSGVAFVLLAAALGFFYIPLRVRETSRGNLRSKVVKVVAASLFVLFAIFISSSLSDKLNSPFAIVSEYVKAFTKRSSDREVRRGIDIRIEESLEALSEQNTVQLVIGKGFGATWSGGTIHDERRNMLHFGIGHLVLNGGILLALLVILGPALMALRVFLKSRSEIPLACAGVLCVAGISTFVANIFAPSLSYLLLSLCVGGSLLHFQKRKPAAHKRINVY